MLIPDEVYQEPVVRGKEEGCSDSFVIEKAIDEGLIEHQCTEMDGKLEEFALEVHLKALRELE